MRHRLYPGGILHLHGSLCLCHIRAGLVCRHFFRLRRLHLIPCLRICISGIRLLFHRLLFCCLLCLLCLWLLCAYFIRFWFFLKYIRLFIHRLYLIGLRKLWHNICRNSICCCLLSCRIVQYLHFFIGQSFRCLQNIHLRN